MTMRIEDYTFTVLSRMEVRMRGDTLASQTLLKLTVRFIWLPISINSRETSDGVFPRLPAWFDSV